MTAIEIYRDIPIKDALRRAAYHEAGHIVIAAQQGLTLRPDGFRINPDAQGLACYWKEPEDNDSSRKSVVNATFAGFNAEQRFCDQYSFRKADGALVDLSQDSFEACNIINSMSGNVFRLQEDLRAESKTLVIQNWPAIRTLAENLLEKDWQPIEPFKHNGKLWSSPSKEKRLGGEEAVSLLAAFGIEASCRYI